MNETLDPATSALGRQTWTQLGDRLHLLAVPIGSCEQHGPHLPLDTDTRIAVAVAQGLASARPDVLVAPTIAISASGEHDGFPGTLSIGTDVLRNVLVELARSAHWAAGVIFVNGHGGNFVAVKSAVALLQTQGHSVTSWWPRFVGGDAHAGRTETSLMLEIAPDTVHHEAAAPGNTEPLADLMPRLTVGGVASVSENGVLGDPAGASAAEGRALLAQLTLDLVAHVARWQS